MGGNINGPSLIRVPEWIPNPLGKYYLYFAHHQGTYIRLAFADRLDGPWHVHRPGVLDLRHSFFNSHIASPDVHVLDDAREVRMYYHGCCLPEPPHQATRVGISKDGLNFTARAEVLGPPYWRVFRWKRFWYSLERGGTVRRSATGISAFEEGPCLFTPNMRHAAVQREGDRLSVFYSNVHDCPERILWSTIDLASDWRSWRAGPPTTFLAPETGYEGADCPLEASKQGAVHHRVCQLRDPCVFQGDGKTWLLYSVAGERGLAIGELINT